MVTDLWIISQLLAQTCAGLLLAGALFHAFALVRYWSAAASDELQLRLERRGYLVGAIAQLVLVFQFVALLLFLFTVNNHLPGIVKGAMCGTGVLGVNGYGYPLLAVKTGSIFFYVAFLIMHHFDESEPAFPLTPVKYYWLMPAFVLLLVDYVLMWLYFSAITPDRIATCCSVTFIGSGASAGALITPGSSLTVMFGLWAGCALVLALLLLLRRYAGLQLLLATGYVFGAVYTLKYFFVKYIYGLSSHYCLFDLFFSNYYYAGYLLFGSYFSLVMCLLYNLFYGHFKGKLSALHVHTRAQVDRAALVSLLIGTAVPLSYWLLWKGDL